MNVTNEEVLKRAITNRSLLNFIKTSLKPGNSDLWDNYRGDRKENCALRESFREKGSRRVVY